MTDAAEGSADPEAADAMAEGAAANAEVRRSWPVMGTQASLIVRVPEQGDLSEAERAVDAALPAVRGRLDAIEAQLSSYIADSQISQLADGRITADQAGDDLRHCLAASAWLQQVSSGVFDPMHSGTLDLAGYVKGWAGDEAGVILDSAGLGEWALGIGGDWVARTRGQDAAPWRLAVRDPFRVDGVAAIVEVGSGAIATSGEYERGSHLTLPTAPEVGSVAGAGQGAGAQAGDARGFRWASFTVTGPRLDFADAFATIGFLMGERGMDWVTSFEGYQCLGIGPDGMMRVSDDFPLAREHGRRTWPRVPGTPGA